MEYLDVVDELGNVTGEIVEREKAHREGIRHSTTHVWLIRKHEDYEILVQKRSDDKDSYPGCYDISSAGHIPAGSNYLDSAVRELEEELGVYTDKNQLIEIGITYSDSNHIFHGKPFHNVQVSKVFLLFYDSEDFTIQKEELAGVKWMKLDECYKAVQENSISNCIKLSELDYIYSYLKKEKKNG